MAARWCRPCNMRIPASGPGSAPSCPICGGEVHYHIWEYPDEDWSERVQAARDAGIEVPDKVILNRTRRFLDAGLAYDDATWFATTRRPIDGGYEVDVTEFEKLAVRAGPALATRILAPLSSRSCPSSSS